MSDLSRHGGDALSRDVSTQYVAPQVGILLVLEVGYAASQTGFVFDIRRLKLLEDLWARGAVKDQNATVTAARGATLNVK